MSQRSSSEPQMLVAYSNFARWLNARLQNEGRQLSGTLQNYERQCRESGFRLPATSLGEYVQAYGEQNTAADDQVGRVGRDFAQADAMGSPQVRILPVPVPKIPIPGLPVPRRGGTPWSPPLIRIPRWLESILEKLPWMRRRVAPHPIDGWLAPTPDGTVTGSGDGAGTIHPEAQKSISPDTRSIAERVPATDADITMYPRTSENSKVSSNCTWYAAAAVKTASNNKINIGALKSLGNASEWAENARKARDGEAPYNVHKDVIADVNRVPAPGSVYCFGGHVAFVEEVRRVEKDGKESWEVVLSEENYYYQKYGVFSKSTEITVPGTPTVKRWRRTVTFDAVDGGVGEKKGEFIHFNYQGT